MRALPLGALLVTLLTAGACDRLAAFGCSTGTSGAGGRPGTEPPAVLRTLSSLQLQLQLPADADVQELSGVVLILINPRHRSPLRITLQPGGDPSEFERWEEPRMLAPNLRLAYRQYVEPGGSGGDDGVLVGTLTLSGDHYQISCRKQSEENPSAQSCLPVLATLRRSAPR